MLLNLEIRSYECENPHHSHDHAQLVLPVRGQMEIDVDGRGGSIDQSLAAVVRPGSVHSQLSRADSCFLVLDCAPALLETLQMEHLARKTYVPISPATRRLIEFAELIGNKRLALDAPQLSVLHGRRRELRSDQHRPADSAAAARYVGLAEDAAQGSLPMSGQTPIQGWFPSELPNLA
nr:hypothetical protein [Pseudomonas sp. CFBP 13727]